MPDGTSSSWFTRPLSRWNPNGLCSETGGACGPSRKGGSTVRWPWYLRQRTTQRDVQTECSLERWETAERTLAYK